MKIKVLFFLFFIYYLGYGQLNTRNDSLITKSYKYLYSKIGEFYNDPEQGNLYAKAYLDKGLTDNKNVKIVEGFYYLADINKEDYSISLKYINNAIKYNQDNPYNIYTPYNYNLKGKLFHKKGRYKEALENYLKAEKFLTPDNDLYLPIEYNIGVLRLRVKDFKNALITSKKVTNLL